MNIKFYIYNYKHLILYVKILLLWAHFAEGININIYKIYTWNIISSIIILS